MLRKLIVAIAAIVAITTALPTDASARWRGHWYGGWHHWHGGWGWGYYGYPYRYYPYYDGGPYYYYYGGPYYGGPYYGGCYRVRRALTPWGWRWRRVWVC